MLITGPLEISGLLLRIIVLVACELELSLRESAGASGVVVPVVWIP